ncbi:MAG: hypothetical protein QME74_01910 [Candidatus Edwardsbacteria bacterium]|nr:hypothetical protein [Candidatus Edwardsbacteria bacterium]
MKRLTIMAISLLTLGCVIAHGEQRFVFSVSPGMSIQSSSFGYKIGKFVPSVGMDVAFMTVDGEYTTSDWGYDWSSGGVYKWATDHSEYSGSAILFMPHLGFKYLLFKQSARPYLTLSATKCMPIVNGNSSSETIYYYPSGGVMDRSTSADKLDETLKNQIQDVLGFWYFTAGFGGEYHFNQSFSVIGESGFRLALTSSDEEGSGSPVGGSSSTAYQDDWKVKMAAVVGITYAKVGLCYYFGSSSTGEVD